MAVRSPEYSECQECGFVLRASGAEPGPKHWDACPDCGADDFAFVGG
jgi:rubredoxin